MNNRIQVPGQLKVNVQQAPGLLAHPISFQFGNGQNLEVASVGGLTKLEQVAALIAAGLVASENISCNPEEAARLAADVAEAVLVECSKRQGG